MTMAEPDPNDPDEIFNQIVSQLDDLNVDPASLPEVSVSVMTDLQLIENFNATKRELYERGEVLNATTDTGRDLQSRYHALLLEMKKRGLQ